MQSAPGLPLIALARGLDILARDRYVAVWLIRLLNCLASMMIAVLEINDLLSPRVLLWIGGMFIGIETVFHLVLQPNASSLHSLARSLLRRELYDSAGYLNAASPDTASIRNRVIAEEPKAVVQGTQWLEKRVSKGKAADGKDFHSTLETEPKYRLLDSLYENFAWWEALAEWTAALYRIPLVVVLGGGVGVLFTVVAMGWGSPDVSVASVRIGLQIVVLLTALNVLQDWHRWTGVAAAFKEGRILLQKFIVLRTPEEEHELHVIASDYAVLAASVPPVPKFIVDRAYRKTDAQLTSDLRSRESERTRLLGR